MSPIRMVVLETIDPRILLSKDRVRIEVIAELKLQVNFIELHRRRNKICRCMGNPKKKSKMMNKRWCNEKEIKNEIKVEC